MSINFPNADFTPQLVGYTGQGAFRFWCQKVLPIVYDDSLSYYELLNKVVNYLNNVIADVSAVEDNIGELSNTYGELQDYVNDHMQDIVDVVNELEQFMNDYFENLDVQEEINDKLNEMAGNGALSTLIAPFVTAMAPNIITNWMNEHITPTSPVVDKSLTISDAAADAYITGYKINKLINSVYSLGHASMYPETPFIPTSPDVTELIVYSGNINNNGHAVEDATRARTSYFNVRPGYWYLLTLDNPNYRFMRVWEYTTNSEANGNELSLLGANYTLFQPSEGMTSVRVTFANAIDTTAELTAEDRDSIKFALKKYSVTDNIIAINANDDLNSYETPGNYYSTSTAITQTLSNCPLSDTGFNLVVAQARYASSGYKRQFLFRNANDGVERSSVYMRLKTSVWGEWRKVDFNDGQYLDVKNGVRIPVDSDLDNYTTPGSYFSSNTAVTASLLNCPLQDTGFLMYVVNCIDETTATKRQVILRNSKQLFGIYVRYRGATSWGPWEMIKTSESDNTPQIIGTTPLAVLPVYDDSHSKLDATLCTFNVAHYHNGTHVYLYDLPKMLMNWRKWIENAKIDILFTQEDNFYIDGKNPDASGDDPVGSKTANDWLYNAYFNTGGIMPVSNRSVFSKLADRAILQSEVVPNIDPNLSGIAICWGRINIANVGTVLVVNCHNFARGSTSYGTVTENLYLNRNNYITKIRNVMVDEMETEPYDYCIVCGDFNAGNYASMPALYDETPAAIQRDYDAILSLCEATDMSPCNGGNFGWFKTGTMLSDNMRAFDNILVSNNIKINSVKCDPWWREDLYSDHVPILADVSFLDKTWTIPNMEYEWAVPYEPLPET